ncbi:MAG: ABC transporter permease [Thermoanaerobacteraceae bacterium]
MKNIYLVELKKFFSQKKTYIIWSVFIFLLFLNLHTTMVQTYHQISDTIDEKWLSLAKYDLERINEVLNNKDNSPDEKKNYKKYLKMKQEEINNLNIVLDKNVSDMEKVKAKMNIIKIMMMEKDDGKLVDAFDIQAFKNEYAYLQYLYDNKIPENNNQNSFYYMFNFFDSYTMLIFVIIIGLISSDSISKEIEESTIKLMLIQPVSRFKIITGKYLALITAITVIIVSTFTFAFIIAGMLYGFGNPLYPFISGMQYDLSKNINPLMIQPAGFSGIYIPAWLMLFRTFVFFILFSIAIASLGFLISEISNSTSISNSIIVIINICLIYIVFATKMLEKFTSYIYISYFNVFKLFSGQIKLILNNNNITPISGVIVMVVMSLFSYFATLILFKRRDI